MARDIHCVSTDSSKSWNGRLLAERSWELKVSLGPSTRSRKEVKMEQKKGKKGQHVHLDPCACVPLSAELVFLLSHPLTPELTLLITKLELGERRREKQRCPKHFHQLEHFARGWSRACSPQCGLLS